jgi:hypothetical protein
VGTRWEQFTDLHMCSGKEVELFNLPALKMVPE